MNTKPPNILIYTGCSSPTLFREIHNNLQKCLRDDKYTIYNLVKSELNERLWMENTLLLIVSCDVVNSDIAEVFETYLKNFGNILFICSKFDDNFTGSKCFQVSDNETLIQLTVKNDENVKLFRGKYSYDTCGTILCYDASKKPVMHKVIGGKNIVIFSEVYLDRDCAFPPDYSSDIRLLILKRILSEEFGLEVNSDNFVPQLTPGYYMTKKEFGNVEKYDKPSEISILKELKLNHFDEFIQLPIYFYSSLHCQLSFNADVYYSKLNSKVYGHQLVYFPTITSTMDTADQLLEYEGIVVIASFQINGKGRSSNKWISAKGCAMFTLNFSMTLNSQLRKWMCLLQHIASLAVVHGIRSQPAYKNLALKIKWPNDIYYNKIKLGGLLVKSSMQNDTANISVGWGINVENSNPTICLNDIISEYNSENSSSVPYLCVEEVIAYILSQMEYFVRTVIEQGPKEIVTLYYSYWMHDNQEITLKNSNEQGVVIGLDDYGYLKVKMSDEKTLSLHPDGNRFDIMKNLIYSI